MPTFDGGMLIRRGSCTGSPLAEPKFIVEIDEYQQACLNLAECIEKVSSQEAVGLLLMFALGRMGYHL